MAPGEPLDERAFHRWLSRSLRGPARGLLPLGDDAAALPIGGGNVAILTTDALVEWTHFLPVSPPEAVGEAAAGASLSDAAAKGGRPIALTLDLLLPAETEPAWARSVVRGADRAMRRFGAAVVGGDTKPSAERAVVGTLLAIGRSDRLAPHGGLRPGDELWTTGVVGAGGVAYRGFTEGAGGDPTAIRRLLTIRPRVAEGLALSRFSHATVDTSDGLAAAAWRLSEASGVRLEIEGASLPLAAGLRAGEDGALPDVTFFGGDYELLAGIPPGRSAAALRAVRSAGGRLTRIGRVAKGHGARLLEGSTLREMPGPGWRPFGRGAPDRAPGARPRASA